MAFGLYFFLGSCASYEPPILQLTGPPRVEVDRLGPVEAPTVSLGGLGEPPGVLWSLSREGVARLDGPRVIAEGPGEVELVAEWEGQRVSWTLVVDLPATLAFVFVPATLTVGEEVALMVQARVGDRTIEAGPIEWSGSDPNVLAVSGTGVVLAVSVGRAYVTARGAGATAMAEVEVMQLPRP